MQAIEVRYLSATNTLGTRLKAECFSGTHTAGRDYSLEVEDDELRVAELLAQKLGWLDKYDLQDAGTLKRGSRVFKLIPKTEV